MASAYGFFSATMVTAPGFDGFVITPSDTQTFTQQGSQSPVCRGIYVGVGGDIVLVTAGGTSLTFKNAQQGSILAIAAQQVKSTNTTATNLLAII